MAQHCMMIDHVMAGCLTARLLRLPILMRLAFCAKDLKEGVKSTIMQILLLKVRICGLDDNVGQGEIESSGHTRRIRNEEAK